MVEQRCSQQHIQREERQESQPLLLGHHLDL
jgi:hypothetical protein